MTQFSWNLNLATTMQRIALVATGSTELAVINAARRVALALPSNDNVTNLVLDLYQPMRLTGKCFKKVAGSLNNLNIGPFNHHYAPDRRLTPTVDWLSEAARSGTIGFLGCNPAHGPRCILTGILPETGDTFIAKLGFDDSAEAVKREHETLMEVASHYPGIAETMGCNMGNDWFMMRLPHLGSKTPENMMAAGVDKLLFAWMSEHDTKLGDNRWANHLIERACVDRSLRGWHRHMKRLTIRSALVHGDFAIWNLRNTPDGVKAIDWEWSQRDGISGVDLVHGLRQEAHLIRKLSTSSAVAWMKEQALSPPWLNYLEKAGWAGEIDNWLRLGLLHSHYNAQNNSHLLLRELGIYVD